MTNVIAAPANNEGSRPIANLRIGAPPIVSALSDGCCNNNAPPASAATNAATSQMISQCCCNAGMDEMIAARTPTIPDAIPVDPGTASAVADSMEVRM